MEKFSSFFAIIEGGMDHEKSLAAEIFFNNQYAGKLVNGKQPLIEFTANPGRQYFLEFNVAGYKVKQVSKDKALGMMNGLKPVESHGE
jgi:hypothetical protein